MHRLCPLLAVRLVFALAVTLLALTPANAVQPRLERVRLDDKVIPDPSSVIAIRALDSAELPQADALRRGWERFAEQEGGRWRAHIDRRTGLPTLVTGSGLSWTAGAGNGLARSERPTLDEIEARARDLFARHTFLLGDWKGQLEFDRANSGAIEERLWLVRFHQVVEGIPVKGAHYDFHVVQGNLVAFGATRWGRVDAATTPRLDLTQARRVLDRHLELDSARDTVELEPPRLELWPIASEVLAGDPRSPSREWTGPVGRGLTHRLVWRFASTVAGEPATWIGAVDAATGQVIAFYDDTRYEQVRGGVFPIGNDGNCPLGCQLDGFPMPFADVTVSGGPTQTASDFGLYTCGSGTARTTLAGPYVRVNDSCGAVSQSAACGSNLALGTSSGADCAVPPGSSAGNTAAARTSFYSLNRVRQKIRAYLPENTWAQGQVASNVNVAGSCNAFWNGSINMYRSGGNCGNTGTLQGVLDHELGHGFDQNDGGGYDNSSEAYADVIAFFQSRESCIGRGFFVGGNCSGYGDTCLNCSGIRDMDWGARVRNEPATPQGFLTTSCGGGGGPCGKEVHCEGYVAGEAVYDLAVRDLPALGYDAATSWQIAEKLWYQSRKGSGGNSYNCALPSSDGCGTNSWFHKLRVADDNDGDLANGTPRAGAIYAAFARHGIACGAAADASNQNSNSCIGLFRPQLFEVVAQGNSYRLSWSAVPGATKYTVLRGDLGCDRAHTIIAEVAPPTATYTDVDVDTTFDVTYRIQASSNNGACLSPVSECEAQGPPLVAYVTEAGRGSLSVIGITTGGNAPISFGLTNPQGVSVRRDLTFAYVTEQGSNELTRVNLDGGASNTLNGGLSNPRGTPRLDLAEQFLYFVESSSGVLRRAPVNGGALVTIASGLSQPADVDLSPDGKTAYVTESGANRLTRVDLASGVKSIVAEGLSGPRGLRLNARETTAYVAESGSGELTAIDLVTGEATLLASGIDQPIGVDINCFESNAYVSEFGAGRVQSVSLATGTRQTVGQGLQGPAGIAMRRDDPEARTIPYELSNLRFTNQTTLAWDAMDQYAGSTTRYDVMYGDLDDVQTLSNGVGHVCAGNDLATTTTADISPTPAPGKGWFFLARGINKCGLGRWQTATDRKDRSSAVCD